MRLLRFITQLFSGAGLPAIPATIAIAFAVTTIAGTAGAYGVKRWKDFKTALRNEGAAQCQTAVVTAEVEALRAANNDLVARLSESQARMVVLIRERDAANVASNEAQSRIADLGRGIQATVPDSIVDIINRPVRSATSPPRAERLP